MAECGSDGSVCIMKPKGTGGLVNTATVGEQLLYEIHNPASYLLPDVTCDFSHVTLKEVGKDCVSAYGAKGHPPSSLYKV